MIVMSRYAIIKRYLFFGQNISKIFARYLSSKKNVFEPFLLNIQEKYKYSIFKQCRGEPIKCGQEEGSDEGTENVCPSGCIKTRSN